MASTQLILERSFYIGNYISAILYGVQLVMFFMSTYYMVHASSTSSKTAAFYTLYGSILLALLTIDNACNAAFGQLMWIEHRDIPGGPAAYMNDNYSLWVNTFGTSSGVTLNFMGDALLLYRCFIIWSSNYKVVIFPALLFLGSTSMSILSVIESAQPGASLFRGKPVSFEVPYVSMTISLNIIVTLLICGRLLVTRKQVQSVLGSEHAKMYTSITAMLVESAAPFTVIGIAYIVTYARTSPTTLGFVQVWGKFSAISPQLIILRVAMGKAWSKETAGCVTDLVFDVNKGSDNTGTTFDFSHNDPYRTDGTSRPEGVTMTASSFERSKEITTVV